MQTVRHTEDYTGIHWIFDDIERFYSCVSDKVYTKTPGIIPYKFDSSLLELARIFYLYSDVEVPESEFCDKPITQLDYTFDSKNIIVCFSGGKDSFAVAEHYKRLGYNVMLYHIKGLNFTYCGKSSEHFVAEKGAEYLGLPLKIDRVIYNGFHKWTEHPMKNMIMMAMALNYGIKSGFSTRIAVGNFTTSYLDDNAFNVCAGDCVEMIECFSNIVTKFIPSFEVLYPNENYEVAYNIMKDMPGSFDVVNSCITSNHHRQQFRNRTENRYNVALRDGRCGCCWKCAVEYIWTVDHHITELNLDYYLHCIEVLAYTVWKETDVKVHGITTLWGMYFFYPPEESILGRRLLDAFISCGKLKFTN